MATAVQDELLSVSPLLIDPTSDLLRTVQNLVTGLYGETMAMEIDTSQ